MKRYVLLFAELLLSALLIAAVCAINGVGAAFVGGENHVYYLSSSSESNVVVSDEAVPALLLFSFVGGESATFTDSTREKIEEEYSASLVYEQSAAGVNNYYYYSPLFSRFVYVNGAAVNLHIAEDGELLVAGTPIIFGGY